MTANSFNRPVPRRAFAVGGAQRSQITMMYLGQGPAGTRGRSGKTTGCRRCERRNGCAAPCRSNHHRESIGRYPTTGQRGLKLIRTDKPHTNHGTIPRHFRACHRAPMHSASFDQRFEKSPMVYLRSTNIHRRFSFAMQYHLFCQGWHRYKMLY